MINDIEYSCKYREYLFSFGIFYKQFFNRKSYKFELSLYVGHAVHTVFMLASETISIK